MQEDLGDNSAVELKAANDRIADLEAQLTGLRDERVYEGYCHDCTDMIVPTELEAKLSQAEAKQLEAESTADSLRTQLASMLLASTTDHSGIADLGDPLKLTQVEEKLEASEEEASFLRSQIDSLRDTCTDISLKLKTAEATNVESATLIAEQSAKLAAAQSELDSFPDIKDRLQLTIDENNALKEDHQNLVTRFTTATTELDDLHSDKLEADSRIEELQQRLDEITRTGEMLDSKEETIQSLQSRLHAVQDRALSAEELATNLEAEFCSAQEDIASFLTTKQQLISGHNETVSGLEQTIENLRAANTAELCDLRDQLSVRNTKLDTAAAEIRMAKSSVDALESALTQNNAHCAQFEKEHREEYKALQEASLEAVNNVKADHKNCQSELTKAKQTIQSLEQDKVSLTETQKTLESTLTKLAHQLEELDDKFIKVKCEVCSKGS